MGRIGIGKIVVPTLVAGVVYNFGEFLLNEVVLVQSQQAAFERMNLQPPGGGAIAVFVLLSFVTMGAVMWTYAAARDKLGPGPKSAACIGVVFWLAGYLVWTVALAVMGMVDTHSAVIGSAWGLVEFMLAAVAGAYFYKD